MIGSAHRGEASGPDRGHRTCPGERNPRDVALDAEEPPGRQPMRYRRSTACASWPPSASATPHKPQTFGYQKHPIGIHAGRSSARSVGQRPGQRCMRLSSHVLVVVFCGLDLGTRRYFRGVFELRPQFVEYVGMRPSNPPRNVASFKNAKSVATAPQLRDVEVPSGQAGDRALLLLPQGRSMTVLVEPIASVYDDRSRLRVILARGRGGFEAYAADDHSLGRARPLPRLPRRVRGSAKPERSQQ
jgi:hypothetical protein